jgi:two-component system response regulator GlrR
MPHLSWTPNEVVSPQVPLVPPRSILLVDPETNDRERYARYLRERGFAVCVCSSYEEGARSLEGKKFDMVIVDQGSPAFEGELVLEMSVARNRKVPVLVLARHHDMASYVEAMQRGAVDYLEKPITRENLMWTIETHLPSGRGFPSKLAS